ncbi:hypothetical protein FCU94_00390 [Vibrio sp. JPW-9-11-11]|uniref:hypothetical protein n=1 Tax=Vibrio sp. JPW-9-11-11 TaxID=1416532 RepID=UPI0015932297|nr:hypothetical protein [Vibrio sp. JPW-9-11-11]NVD05377.1 hypothetical protein [Vibrio sp. JPW-9-11-11]
MNELLSLSEKKSILRQYSARADGRHQELLDAMIDHYPKPMSGLEIKQALKMQGPFALSSALRNSKIFLEIDKVYDSDRKQWVYVLDNAPIARAKAARLMNQLV